MAISFLQIICCEICKKKKMEKNTQSGERKALILRHINGAALKKKRVLVKCAQILRA